MINQQNPQTPQNKKNTIKTVGNIVGITVVGLFIFNCSANNQYREAFINDIDEGMQKKFDRVLSEEQLDELRDTYDGACLMMNDMGFSAELLLGLKRPLSTAPSPFDKVDDLDDLDDLDQEEKITAARKLTLVHYLNEDPNCG